MQKAVILKLRVAKRSDFSDALGKKRYGCMYFEQSFDGSFCNQPFFFNENTNMEIFKELFSTKQIWVLAGIFDQVEFDEIPKPHLKNLMKKQSQIKKKSRPCTCAKSSTKRKYK